jgi:hypothetical protein
MIKKQNKWINKSNIQLTFPGLIKFFFSASIIMAYAGLATKINKQLYSLILIMRSICNINCEKKDIQVNLSL